MKFWIVTADYRKPNEHSPQYAFLSPSNSDKKYVAAQFKKRYVPLKIIKIEELSAEEMEANPIVKWIMWL